jgi:GxxExxY protein
MNENQITTFVMNAAFAIHTKLGPGLLETVYEVILAHELRKQGLRVERQVPIPISYDGLRFDEGFRADLVVEDKVIVELKSIEALLPVHAKQVLTQIKLTDRKLGLLINFGADRLKDGIKRLINGTLDPEDVTL